MRAVLGLLLVGCGLVISIACSAAPPLKSKAVLVLGQASALVVNPGYHEIFSSLRSILNSRSSPVTIYGDGLDLVEFGTPQYKQVLQTYLSSKYSGLPIDAIVTLGPLALRFALQMDQWRDVPIVFAAVNDDTLKEASSLLESRNLTGKTLHFSAREAVEVAHLLVPNLKTIALIGDRPKNQPFRRHYRNDLAQITHNFELIDLTGLPIAEISGRIAALPTDTVIFYTAITRDGDGRTVVPEEACGQIAKTTNRPIVVDVNTRVGPCAAGGFVIKPALIGEEAGQLVARILDGEQAAQIPISPSRALGYEFDWRKLQSFKVNEAMLPPSSLVRFREPSFLRQYYWQIWLAGFLIVLQTILITGLVIEDRRRRWAEDNTLRLRSELAQTNRMATAGELSASIAHEIRQPLTAIVAQGNAALNWLAKESLDLNLVKAALACIVEQGHRAGEVIDSVRAIFAKDQSVRSPVDINEMIRDVVIADEKELKHYGVTVRLDLEDPLPQIMGSRLQIQQVILNLIANAIEAMKRNGRRTRILHISSGVRSGKELGISIEDSGPGICDKDLAQISNPFFTTKQNGMGLGLSICRSIVDGHGGRLDIAASRYRGAQIDIVFPSPNLV